MIHPKASWLQVFVAVLSRLFWPTEWATNLLHYKS
jgi:hypothetical protein